jgi:hypothetical protein
VVKTISSVAVGSAAAVAAEGLAEATSVVAMQLPVVTEDRSAKMMMMCT